MDIIHALEALKIELENKNNKKGKKIITKIEELIELLINYP